MYEIKKVLVFWLIIILVPILVTSFFSNKKKKEDELLERKIIVEGNNFTREMTMEEFIPFVLMAQMPIDSPKELLKAQTIVIRTYILLRMGMDNKITSTKLGLPFIMPEKLKEIWFEQYKLKKAGTFKGMVANFFQIGDRNIYKSNMKKLRSIINKTQNYVMTWQDELILPLFHNVSNGKTRNGEEILGDDFKYLLSVDCYSSQEVEGSYFKIKLTATQIVDRLEKSGIIVYKDNREIFNVDKVSTKEVYEAIQLTNIDSAGYNVTVQIGDTIVSGMDFAKAMGLKSCCFNIKNMGEYIEFTSDGDGHGFGMSLSYARQLAKDGAGYKDILKTFYQCEIGN